MGSFLAVGGTSFITVAGSKIPITGPSFLTGVGVGVGGGEAKPRSFTAVRGSGSSFLAAAAAVGGGGGTKTRFFTPVRGSESSFLAAGGGGGGGGAAKTGTVCLIQTGGAIRTGWAGRIT